MANIRINDLPSEAAPNASDVSAVDGTSTRKATLTAIVNAGRPFASQAEAEAGTSPTKAMSPLTTAQAIAALGATAAAGVPVGGTINQVLGKTSGVDYAMSWRNAGAGDMIAAANLSDVASAATSLANLGGQPLDADLTSWAGVTRAAGFDTFVATPSSANLRTLLTDETGTGAAVFATSPTLVTPALGTPSAAVLTNAIGLPVASGISGLGTGVAAFLATPSSANLATAVTGETGTGALVFGTSPTLVTPALGAATATSINFGGTSLSAYAENPYTPTITATSGTFTSVSASGGYTRVGRLVTVQIAITITTVGTATFAVIATLPFTANAAGAWVLSGRETVLNGKMLQGAIVSGGTTVSILFYDNTSAIAAGAILILSGSYWV